MREYGVGKRKERQFGVVQPWTEELWVGADIVVWWSLWRKRTGLKCEVEAVRGVRLAFGVLLECDGDLVGSIVKIVAVCGGSSGLRWHW